MKLDRDRAALVLVDYQARLMPSIAGADAVLREAAFVADVARALGVPVVGTEQNPDGLGPNVDAVRRRCDRTLAKRHFDACADGLLDALAALRPPGGGSVERVVVAGCEAHVCLLQTALGLRAAGLAVAVVADACGSRRPGDRALALRRLERAGATLVGSEMVAFEWLGSCDDAAFRDVLRLVKARPGPDGD